MREINQSGREKKSPALFLKLVGVIACSLTKLGVFDIRLRKKMNPSTAVGTTLSDETVKKIHSEVDIKSALSLRLIGKQTPQDKINKIDREIEILNARLAEATGRQIDRINRRISSLKGARGWLKSQLE